MNRFSKGAVLTRLDKTSEYIRVQNEFDPGDGWAQLREWMDDTANDESIQRAVAYGTWRAYQTMAEIIRSGDI